MATKPTQSIFPVENGKLTTDLDANNFAIHNLDVANSEGIGGGGGGGGNDTGTTIAILKGNGNHGFADAVDGIDYVTPDALATKEPLLPVPSGDLFLLTRHNVANGSTWLFTDPASITGTTTGVTTAILKGNGTGGFADASAGTSYTTTTGDYATPTQLNAGLATKEPTLPTTTDDSYFLGRRNIANGSTWFFTDLNTAIGNKADSSSVSSALAGKEPTLPTTATDSWILARHNAGSGGAWFFVDPLTLGTTNQTFTDGVSNTTTTYTSATAIFVANDVGKAISGTDIPAGTTIASRTNGTTIVLSQAATGTHTGNTFTIYNRVETTGGSGTVTSVSVNNDAGNVLFTTGVSNPTTGAAIGITMPVNVPANTFYGNGATFPNSAAFMSATVARTALGGTTVGQALFQLANPSAVSYPQIQANNSVITRTAAQTLGDLGAESALTFAPIPPFSRTGNTITLAQATSTTSGYLPFADFAAFAAKVPSTRQIIANAPLTALNSINTQTLTSDITLSIPPSAGDSAGNGQVNGYLSGADHSLLMGRVPASRSISLNLPLGFISPTAQTADLSANRTINLPKATASQDGYLAATDFAIFAGGSVNALAITQTGGAVTVSDSVPPVTRIVITAALASNLTITLPLAAGYNAGNGYSFLEIVDVVPGGAQASFGITLQRKTSDAIDAQTTYVMARGMTYLRLSSNGAQNWTSVRYFVDSFRDPLNQTRQLRINIPAATATWPTATTRTVTPALGADSMTVVPLTALTSPKQFLTGLTGPSDTINGGRFTTSTVSMTDIQTNEYLVGNAPDTGITNDGTVDTIKLNAGLTAIQQYTFPNVQLYSSGETVRFYAATGTVGTTNFARVISGSGNTFNGSQTIDITEPFFNRMFVADPNALPSGNWTVSTFGGTTSSGLALDTWHPVTVASNAVTLACSANVVENYHIVTMSTATSVSLTGVTPGQRGRVKFRDSTGSNIVTPLPNAFAKTPTTSGTGVFTTSTGACEDEYGWDFDGQFYNWYPLGKLMIAATPTGFNTLKDDTTAASGAVVNMATGTTNGNKFGLATKFIPATSYLLGKIRLSLFKTGTINPALAYRVAVYSDSGATTPGTLLSGSSASAPILASTFNPTTAADVDFNTNATVSAGLTYWIVLYEDAPVSPTFDAANFVSWAGHATATYTTYQSLTGASWVAISGSKLGRFQTYTNP